MKTVVRVFYFACVLLMMSMVTQSYLMAEDAQDIAEKIVAKRLHEEETINGSISEAKKLYEDKHYEEALDKCKSILRQQPTNKEAQDLVQACNQKLEAYNAAKTVERKKKEMQRIMNSLDDEFIKMYRRKDERDLQLEERVRTHVEEMKSLWETGNYDGAIDVCESIIEFSPDNHEAQRRINEVIADLRRYREEDSDIVKRQRLIAVRHAWLPPQQKTAEDEVAEDDSITQDNIISNDKQQLFAKAKRIIPEINFTNAHLRDVIQYLSKISEVNIILDEQSFPGDGYNSEDPDDRITISLKNIPLLEALKYILITKGMEFRIEDHAIWIAKDVEDIEMISRMYPLPAGTGVQRLLEYEGVTQEENLTGAATIETGGDVTQLLREAVPFPPGSKVFLDPRTSTLLVTNTVANHSLIEEVLKNITEAPLQVQIEAKFVEILENDGQELGLEFFLTDDYSLTG
ncbi:hypothetical protein KDK77_08655, partial [bacterium]|nr:hypothetical protein [bacterium]